MVKPYREENATKALFTISTFKKDGMFVNCMISFFCKYTGFVCYRCANP